MPRRLRPGVAGSPDPDQGRTLSKYLPVRGPGTPRSSPQLYPPVLSGTVGQRPFS